MTTTALTKTLRDGRVATVDLALDDDGEIIATVRLSGVVFGQARRPVRSPGLPAGYVATIARLGLTAEELATVNAAIEAFKAVEAGHPVSLVKQRRHLVGALVVAGATYAATRAAALAAFDQAHPDIAAAAEAERQATARRHIDAALNA